ncbi:hypothetical protein ACQ4PT_052327 [Festuca glaucescens]
MAVEEAAESCGSHAAAAAGSASPPAASGAQSRKQQQQQRHKLEVYTQVLRRLQDAGVPEGQSPGFEDELWSHFNRLPARYAMDVNVERAEDVLTHKRLLGLAKDPALRPAFAVRAVQGKLLQGS